MARSSERKKKKLKQSHCFRQVSRPPRQRGSLPRAVKHRGPSVTSKKAVDMGTRCLHTYSIAPVCRRGGGGIWPAASPLRVGPLPSRGGPLLVLWPRFGCGSYSYSTPILPSFQPCTHLIHGFFSDRYMIKRERAGAYMYSLKKEISQTVLGDSKRYRKDLALIYLTFCA